MVLKLFIFVFLHFSFATRTTNVYFIMLKLLLVLSTSFNRSSFTSMHRTIEILSSHGYRIIIIISSLSYRIILSIYFVSSFTINSQSLILFPTFPFVAVLLCIFPSNKMFELSHTTNRNNRQYQCRS